MSVFHNPMLLSPSGASAFDTTLIGNSVWFDGSADFLSKTFSSGSAQTKVVISTWVQRTSFGSAQDIFGAIGGTGGATRENRIHFQDDDTIDIQLETTNAKTIIYSTTRVFRDISWYHILLSIDQGETVGPAQVNLFVNGVAVTIAATVLDQGFNNPLSSWGNACSHTIGKSTTFCAASQTQTTFLVGQSIQSGDVAVTDFLEAFSYGTNGSQFGPKSNAAVAALASTAGGNSFCIDYADSSALGTDASSAGNDFALTSMAAANQSNSSPSLVFSQWNIHDANAAFTSTNNGMNTFVVTNVGGVGMRSTIPMTEGKWYWEQRNDGSNENGLAVSAGQNVVNIFNGAQIGEGSGSNSCYLTTTGAVRINAGTGSTTGVTNGATDVIGMCFDTATGKVWYRDSSGFGSSGDPANGTGEHATLTVASAPFFIAAYTAGAVAECILNAGGNPTFNGLESAGGNADANGFGNFKLGAPPTGFLSLCSANLPTPETQGVDHFAITLAQEGSLFSAMDTAEGNFSGSDTLRIYKSRVSAVASETWGYSFSHDATNEYILPSINAAMTFGSIRSLSGTDNYVGYSIHIDESAGTAMGVQAHTNGADTTITHGLTTSRCIILLFNRSGGDILYFHPDISSGTLLKLNSSVLPFSSTIITDVTTTTFDIGAGAGSATYDYLVLAETPGMTDIFSYIGNSNTNGPFIPLNARPELLVAKLTTTHATEQILLGKGRHPFNGPNTPNLLPNQNTAEGTSSVFNTDFLAGALKLRNSSTDMNFGGGLNVGWTFGSIAGNGTLPPIYGE